ncbi:antibiotic biosynthesis monooxygenase [Paracoccus aurantiacus]|uniref:Antibiotic biosynthesis monooxygenase n=1 Tax=Paracoccus aurantiacus TaxID=2599412 RepID=A0A5C6S4X0_9RHOB|nr:antibiotic biosynthesis monooxygenase [Paracoccus aurantiacus]TXB68643.1 antibiotic biosynthesis monooxygenase [Paracoccus aurantiacus]
MSCSCGHDHDASAHLGRPDPAPGQIALSVKLFCADAAEMRIALEHLPDHVALSRAEPGCMFFAAEQSDDPAIWLIEELYADEAALNAHKARLASSEWSRISAALKREITRIDG